MHTSLQERLEKYLVGPRIKGTIVALSVRAQRKVGMRKECLLFAIRKEKEEETRRQAVVAKIRENRKVREEMEEAI